MTPIARLLQPVRGLATAPYLTVATLQAIGSALLLLGGATIGLGRALVLSDRFTRRQTIETLDRGLLRPLPFVGLLSILLGTILGLSIASAFAVLHVERLLLPLLRHALMRNSVPILIGLIVIGRAGLPLVARLSAIQGSGEADTMRTLGIAPADWVLPQALLYFVLLAATQFMWSSFVAQLAAALILRTTQGVPIHAYVDILHGASARSDFWSGVGRCEATAVYVWMVAATAGVMISHRDAGPARATQITFAASLLGLLAIATLFTWAGA